VEGEEGQCEAVAIAKRGQDSRQSDFLQSALELLADRKEDFIEENGANG
jgi:hypothetical protein